MRQPRGLAAAQSSLFPWFPAGATSSVEGAWKRGPRPRMSTLHPRHPTNTLLSSQAGRGRLLAHLRWVVALSSCQNAFHGGGPMGE